ncbi:hypothetical protein JCM11641_004598 [Rhodosporidiobolus odoratus]
MASIHTSTPRSANSYYSRPTHQRGPSAVTDTPTPSSHNSIPPYSSIRPMASTSNLKDLGTAALKRRATLTAQGGLRAGSPNTLNRDRPSSRLSKSSLFDSELEGLAEPIQRDNTELDRINKENSIQRIIGDLQNDRVSLSSRSRSSGSSRASRSSAGELEQERRREFVDEEQDGCESASSRSSRASSMSSFRIGMAGGKNGYDTDPLDPLDPPTEDDITYVTLPRSLDSPAASPYKSAAGSPAPPAPRAAGGLFGGSPRPIAASSPLRPSRYADENVAPAPSSAPAPAPFRRSPFAAAASPASPAYPTVPARANPPPTFIRSPYVAPSQLQSRPSPLNPQVNSPILGNSPTTTHTGSASRSATRHHASHYFSAVSERQAPAAEADRTTFSSTTLGGGVGGGSYRIPNATVLTEALGSPERKRPTIDAKLFAGQAKPVEKASPARSGSTGTVSTGKSAAAANLVSQGIASLTGKLAALERENAASSARVAELETQLASASSRRQTQTREQTGEVGTLRREVERLLAEERGRYAELERVVASLRSQNTHLDAVLEQQHADLDSLRRERAAVAASVPAPSAEAFQAGDELRHEVHDLKQGLEVLGYEVDGVRTVVEELLRDKEEREAGRMWEVEEEERRRVFQQQQQAERAGDGEDLDATPRAKKVAPASVTQQQRREEGTFETPGTPASSSGRSFVSAAEIERLRAEQEVETSRRTPKAHRRHKHVHLQRSSTPPPRPSSAPVHRTTSKARRADVRSIASYDESYRPSTATFDGESVSYSQGSATYVEDPHDADEEDASSYFSEKPEVLPPLPASRTHTRRHHHHHHRHVHGVGEDEPDFGRAEQIFADVSRVTDHSPRRKTRRSTTATHTEKKGEKNRVVLVEEPSVNLCSNCHGRKKELEKDESREKERERERREQEREERAKDEVRRKEKEKEEHRQTLEGVLERLEADFEGQKKIYLELTAEYQSMSSRHESSKRKALASHLKKSIDVLEEKAKDVKQYADALENLYASATSSHTCPATSRKRHAVV